MSVQRQVFGVSPSEEMENFLRTRRVALRCALGAGVGLSLERAFAASEFWNQKSSPEWTSDEVRRLMTKSPWAKEVNIGRRPDPNGQDAGIPTPDSGGLAGGGPGGMGGYGGYGGYGGMGGYGRQGGAKAADAAIVRWESAQPILDATKETLPVDFAGHYVIAVAGLPVEWAMGRPRRGATREGEAVRLSDIIDRLKAGATLEARGKGEEGAGLVKRAPSDEAWLFGFSKELLPLGPGDKGVEFTLKSGPMVVSARFTPKEMMYKGQFAA